MKKLLRILVLAAIVWGVVWLTRDRMLPPPRVSSESPPPFRHGEAAEAGDAGADDLKAVKGIGPVYESRLTAMGITTYAQLAASDTARVSDALDVGTATVDDWKAQAADLG
jgi:large subunit ribosomal protein L21